MADEIQNKPYASSFQTKKIALYKVGEESGTPYANLLGMVAVFKYYEDVFLPTYGATMVVTDNSKNLISSMPLQGFELVVVEVEDALNNTYEYRFRVWTVANRMNKERRQVYTLGLVSEEALINEGVRVNTIIQGNVAEQVQKLLKEKLNATDVQIEKSANSVKLLPTKKTPFAVIRSLQLKTIPENVKPKSKTSASSSASSKPSITVNTDVGNGAQKASGTAGYLFFRTRKGFVFKSMDALASSDTKAGGSAVVNAANPFIMAYGKDNTESLYKIQEVVFNSEINMMKKLREGVFSSIVCYFNINTGKYSEYVYSLADVWKDMVHMGSQTNLPGGQAKLGEYPSRVMSTVVNHENWYVGTGVASNDSDDQGEESSDNEFPDWQKEYLSQGISRIGIMFNQELTISLTGHLELCAGDKVEIRIPNQVDDEKRKDEVWDPEHSGTYLIKKLNHQFDIQNQTVYTVLDLMRDSYGIAEKESKVGT